MIFKTWVTRTEANVGGLLMVAMLVLSPVIVVPLVLTGLLRGLWEVEGAWVGASVLLALAAGALALRSRRLRPGVTWGAFAHGFLMTAVARAFYGALLLVTGMQKTGFRHVSPGRRIDSIYDFLFSAALVLLAGSCASVHRVRSERRHARSR